MNRPDRALVAFLPILVALVPGAAAWAAPGGSPPGDRLAASSAETITMDGGDLVTLPRPVVLRSARALGRSWTTVDIDALAQIPSTGMGAAVLEATSSSASAAGAVLVRPYGATGAGVALLRYSRTYSRGLGLSKSGTGGRIQVRSTGGAPVTSLRLTAWVPETAPLVVPASPGDERKVAVSSTVKRIKIVGTGAVPSGAGAVVVALSATSRRPGSLAAWTGGGTGPAYGEAFPAGTSSFIEVVRPAADGTIALRALRGTATAGVTVLGWATGSTVLTARGTPARLLAARPGAVRAFRVAGTASIPSAAQDTWLSVAAPAGATVSVWGNATGSGAALHTWRSNGAAVSLLLPVPTGGRASIRVARTTGTTNVIANGYDSSLGGQKLSLVPREGTHLLGAADIESLTGSQLVLGATADKVAPGDFVMARAGDLTYVLQATGATPLSGDRQQVETVQGTLGAAFADFKAAYHGAVLSTGSPKVAAPVNARSVSGGSAGISLGGGNWSCGASGGVPSFSAGFSGDANFDVDLAGGTVDLSVKGSLTSSLTLTGSEQLSCSYDFPALTQVPLGTTGLVFKASPTAAVSLQPPSGGVANLSLASSQRVYAALYYAGGEPVVGKALALEGSDNSTLGRGTARFDLGMKAAIGLPELASLTIGPEASITLGSSISVGPPEPEGPLYLQLAGPHCTDASQNMFVAMGAAVLVPFLPDATIDVARYDTDPLVFHRGPCVGYSGTITYRWSGSYPQGGAGCTAQSCPSKDWNHTMVRTMNPGLASFEPSYGIVVQPYSWTWSGREVVEDDIPMTYDGSVSTHCVFTDTGTGSGAASWSDFEALDPWMTKSWQGYDPNGGTYASSDFVGGSSTSQRAVVGDPDWCGTPSTSSTTPPMLDANPEQGVLGVTSMDKPTINATLTGHPPYHPERAWTIAFDLTRVEFAR